MSYDMSYDNVCESGSRRLTQTEHSIKFAVIYKHGHVSAVPSTAEEKIVQQICLHFCLYGQKIIPSMTTDFIEQNEE